MQGNETTGGQRLYRGWRWLYRGWRWLYRGWQRWRERRQLQRLDLYDFGLAQRSEIEREVQKPWWIE